MEGKPRATPKPKARTTAKDRKILCLMRKHEQSIEIYAGGEHITITLRIVKGRHSQHQDATRVRVILQTHEDVKILRSEVAEAVEVAP